jgi:hypothetical protein
MLWYPRYIYIYINIKNSNFCGISKFLKLIVFGQVLANFGGFQQIWANSPTLVVAGNMAKASLKLKSPPTHQP